MIIDLVDAYLHDDNTILAVVDKTDEGGEVVRLAHLIPRDTLEWRAAEYGIDPDDTDTLLDIVLFEPHMQIDPEKHLYMAATVDEAREHLLGQVSARKAASEALRGQKRPSPGSDSASARSRVLEMCHMDRQVVALKAGMVSLQRVRTRQERARRAMPENRRTRYETMLKEMTNAADAHRSPRAVSG